MFARIFLSFWVAIVLIAAAAVTLTAWNFAVEDDNPAAVTRRAAQIYAAEGIVGLREWLRERNKTQAPHRLFIFGPGGQEILGQPLPEFLARRRARQLERAGPPPDNTPPPFVRERRFGPAASVFRAASGEVYRLRFEPPPRRGPFEPPFSWELRVSLLALAVAISGLISYALARSISSPLQRLQTTARRLATGDLSARSGDPVTARRDEIGRLGRDFDAMAERLSALLDARQHLLRDISHELRSPLTRLQLALSLARQHPDNAAAQFDRIELESHRLDALVGQILEYARLDRDPASLQRETVDLGELVAQIVEDARFENRGGAEAVTISRLDPAKIAADAQIIHAAIDNVLRNALIHGAPPVDIALAVTGGSTVLTVRDHGPGVPEAELARIFEPFYRVLRQDMRSADGTGVGLAIAARAASLHGARIQASNAPGGGLEVRIVFEGPDAPPAPA